MQGRLARNLAARWLLLVLSSVFGAWAAPVLVGNFGSENYGLFALAFSISNYVTLLATPMASTMSRFLLIARKLGDQPTANADFSTGFVILTIFAALLGMVVLGFLWTAPSLFNLEDANRGLFNTLLVLLGAASLAIIYATHFRTCLFELNRLDLGYMIDSAAILARAGAILVVVGASLALDAVAFGYLLASCLLLVLSVVVWRRLAPELRLRLGLYSPVRARVLLPMTLWLFLDHACSLVLNNFDLFLVASLFGAREVGDYAIALLPATVLRSMSGIISNNLAPSTSHLIAEGNLPGASDQVRTAAFWNGIFIGFPAALAAGFASDLLGIWMGSEFSRLAPLMVIVLCHLGLNSCASPMFIVSVARNRVRVPMISTFAAGATNVALAALLARYTSLSSASVAVSVAVALSLKHAVFTPLYTAYLLNVPYSYLVRPVLQVLLICVCMQLAATGIRRWIEPQGIVEVIGGLAIASCLSAALVFVLAPQAQRRQLVSAIRRASRILSAKIR